MRNRFTLLLATDSSDRALEAMHFLPRLFDLRRVERAKALLLAWPDDNEPIPDITASELERFDRFLQLLEQDGAVIEGERASGNCAEDVLLAAEAIDASMIILALAFNGNEHRGSSLAAQIATRSRVPVLTLHC